MGKWINPTMLWRFLYWGKVGYPTSAYRQQNCANSIWKRQKVYTQTVPGDRERFKCAKFVWFSWQMVRLIKMDVEFGAHWTAVYLIYRLVTKLIVISFKLIQRCTITLLRAQVCRLQSLDYTPILIVSRRFSAKHTGASLNAHNIKNAHLHRNYFIWSLSTVFLFFRYKSILPSRTK